MGAKPFFDLDKIFSINPKKKNDNSMFKPKIYVKPSVKIRNPQMDFFLSLTFGKFGPPYVKIY